MIPFVIGFTGRQVLFSLLPFSNIRHNLLSPISLLTLVHLYDIDLNYRVDLPDAQMRRILRDEEWKNKEKFEALLRFDQVCGLKLS